MKIKICLDDPETRAIWESALEAKREVASWPAWNQRAVGIEVMGNERSTPQKGRRAKRLS